MIGRTLPNFKLILLSKILWAHASIDTGKSAISYPRPLFFSAPNDIDVS